MASIKFHRYEALLSVIAECGSTTEQKVADVLVTKYSVLSIEAFMNLIDLKAHEARKRIEEAKAGK